MGKIYEAMKLPRVNLCLRIQNTNLALVPFSESVMFENISESQGSGSQKIVVESQESPTLSSSIVIDLPTCPRSFSNIDTCVGSNSVELEERISGSYITMSREYK